MTDTSNRESRGLQTLVIDDFTPGIYDGQLLANSSPPNTVSNLFPAPPGAADVTNTFGCMAMPNGGLGPLPGVGGQTGSSGQSMTDITVGSFAGAADVTALTNSFQAYPDELLLAVTPAPSGGFQTTTFYSLQIGIFLHTIQTATYSFTAGFGKNFCAYPFPTFVNISASEQPEICLPLAAASGPNSNLMVYPPNASPTSFSVDVIATSASANGNAFGHQGRIVVIAHPGYNWPVAPTIYPNNLFNYTDPAQSETWPVQAETFGPEAPFGYGGVSSVSAGELFCVKCRGGAIVIQGDLNNPTVTSLPGVKSTGPFFGRTDTDPNGSYYCSQSEGAWVWNGGNASTKISRQLEDNFYVPAHGITDTSYYGYYVQRWGEWMLFSNNWIFDSSTGGWWRLEDPNYKSFFWYVPSFFPTSMFAATPTVATDTTKFLFQYDRAFPRPSYNWQSLPLKLPSFDRGSTVREVVIKASNPYGDPAPAIDLSLIDDKGGVTDLDTWNMTPGTNTIQSTRLNSAMRQSTTVALSVVASGRSLAPIIHSFAVGYRTREHIAIT